MSSILRTFAGALAVAAGGAALCQTPPAPPLPAPTLAPPSLPAPSADPLHIDFSRDPVLRLSQRQTPPDQFRAVVGTAVERHPGTLEAEASTAEARAVVSEAWERRL